LKSTHPPYLFRFSVRYRHQRAYERHPMAMSGHTTAKR